MSVLTKGNAKGTRQTKVGNLDDTLVVEQQILGLQIAMNDTTRMTKDQTVENLLEIALEKITTFKLRTAIIIDFAYFHKALFHILAVWDQVEVLFQVHRQKLENQMQTTILQYNILKAAKKKTSSLDCFKPK